MKPILLKKNVEPFLKRFVPEIDAWLEKRESRMTVDWTKMRNEQESLVISIVLSAKVRGIKFYNSYSLYVAYDASRVEFRTRYEDGPPSEMVGFDTFVTEWIRSVHTEIVKQKGARVLSNKIRQELAAAVWHPRRVAWRLEVGGWDAIDAMN